MLAHTSAATTAVTRTPALPDSVCRNDRSGAERLRAHRVRPRQIEVVEADSVMGGHGEETTTRRFLGAGRQRARPYRGSRLPAATAGSLLVWLSVSAQRAGCTEVARGDVAERRDPDDVARLRRLNDIAVADVERYVMDARGGVVAAPEH